VYLGHIHGDLDPPRRSVHIQTRRTLCELTTSRRAAVGAHGRYGLHSCGLRRRIAHREHVRRQRRCSNRDSHLGYRRCHRATEVSKAAVVGAKISKIAEAVVGSGRCGRRVKVAKAAKVIRRGRRRRAKRVRRRCRRESRLHHGG